MFKHFEAGWTLLGHKRHARRHESFTVRALHLAFGIEDVPRLQLVVAEEALAHRKSCHALWPKTLCTLEAVLGFVAIEQILFLAAAGARFEFV